MFRAIPTNNKLCFDKELKRSWKIHEEKIKNIKSPLRQKKPQRFTFLAQRPKKAMILEFRNSQVDKENRSLLMKIRTIGQKDQGCKTSYLNQTCKSYFGSDSMERDRKHTLNEPFRKKELDKIVRENQQIMKRIQAKKSEFNVKKWSQERKRVQKNINLISTYPYKNYPNTQTKVNLWMTEEDMTKKSRVSGQSRVKPHSLIYSGTAKIGDSYYMIESYLNKKVFNIDIQNLEDLSEKYRMEMSEEEAYEMLEKQFKGELRNLIDGLSMDREQGVCYLKCTDENNERDPDQLEQAHK